MPPILLLKRLLSLMVVGFVVAVGLPFERGGLQAADYPKPPPPREYHVEIRYQIYADLNQRIIQFQDLIRYLESIGFRKKAAEDPRAEIADPRQTRMNGTIVADRVRQIRATGMSRLC